jgi:hypothetical protein
MDRRDGLGPRLEDALCAACHAPVSSDCLRILARRDGLAFIEVACNACSSWGLAIVLGPAGCTPDGRVDPEALPVSAADVRAVADFLADYRGGVDGLFGGPGGSAA